MASEQQIDRAFADLGALFAAEHSEHDDDGARQVGRLIRLLRKFKAHEQAEHAPKYGVIPAFREASYALPDGRAVWYDDGRESVQDAADLYAVLPEAAPGGSPNLENLQARHILDRLQTGQGLGETHIATLRGLLSKHRAKIDALRATPDRRGQDVLAQGDPGSSARIIAANERA